jgi:hypothetical protein
MWFNRLAIAIALWLLVPFATFAGNKGGGGSVHVRGYYRKNGTYVAPHTRSAPSHGGGVAALEPFIAPVPPPQPSQSTPRPRADAAALKAKNAEEKAKRKATPKAASAKLRRKTKSPVPRTIYVKGYYKADGTWVEPHTRYIDGVKDDEEGTSVDRTVAPASGDRESRPVDVRALTSRRPRMTARTVPRSQPSYSSGARATSQAIGIGSVAALSPQAGSFVAEEEDGLGEDEREDAADQAENEADDADDLSDCEAREWHTPDGNLLAIGCFRSRVGKAIWIQTDSSHMLKLDLAELHDDDVEYLENMR